jgi:ATP-binding cassette, subfamily C (CFTR/MRP), member 4
MLQCLLRMVEICDGTIYIDNVDTKTVSLKQLRSGFSVIPQDPIIFSGTLRSNIDPFDQFDDNEIWNALESCQLLDSVKKFDLGLSQEISENGSNLSVGERQLLCLCRSLLVNSKIVLLDEATANVDINSDRSKFNQ